MRPLPSQPTFRLNTQLSVAACALFGVRQRLERAVVGTETAAFSSTDAPVRDKTRTATLPVKKLSATPKSPMRTST